MSVRGCKFPYPTWGGSANGMEIRALVNNDGALMLDEVHQAKQGVVSDTAYKLPNGAGATTMTQERKAREVYEWTATVVSTGEKSMAAAIAKDLRYVGGAATAGQLSRAIDIDATMNNQYGAFDATPNMKPGKAFADDLMASVKRYHGTPLVFPL